MYKHRATSQYLIAGQEPTLLGALVAEKEPPQGLIFSSQKPWISFGGLDLYEEIGRGGMGIVYRARQKALDRIVAVKVLMRGHFAGAEERLRFQREARAAARLNHPGIIAVHDVGEEEGMPWFTMDFIPGSSLEQVVREQPLEAREAALYVLKIAHAIKHAHEHGVLHRDLKPSNILINGEGEPLVSDFGIAHIAGGGTTTGGNTELTRTGQALGSPSYAAPEQALRGEADVRTDIYGLGALLYHLLTTRPPFLAPTVEAILVLLRDSDPIPPRRVNASVPRDLETICLKCLQKNPGQRYATVVALADDLDRFLAGKPIHARPLSLAGRLWRWTCRHPGVAALLGLVLLLLVGLVGGALAFASHQARQERRATLVSEARSLRQQRDANARQQALEKLRQAWKIAPSEEIRNESAASLMLSGFAPVRTEQASKMRSAPKLKLSGVPEDALVAYDDEQRRAAVSLRGKGEVRVLALPDGQQLALLQHPLPVTSLDWSGDLIATGCDNRFVYIWSEKGELKHRLSGHEAIGILVAFRPGTQQLASVAHDAHIRLWHAARGQEIIHLDHHHESYASLSWSADGLQLQGAHKDSSIADVFELQDASWMKLLSPPQEEPHPENFGSAAISPDGRLAAVIDESGCRLWDIEKVKVLSHFSKNPIQWISTQFAPDGRALWVCGFDIELQVVPLVKKEDGVAVAGAAKVALPGYGRLLRAISKDCRHILLSDNGVGVIMVFTPESQRLIQISHGSCLAAAIAADGSWVVASSFRDRGFKVWSLPGASMTHALLPNHYIQQVEQTADSSMVLVLADNQLHAFRTSDWSELPLPEHKPVRSISLAGDRSWVAFLGDDNVSLHDPVTLKERIRLVLPAHAGWLGDGHLIYNASSGHLLVHTALVTVIRWDMNGLEKELEAMGMGLQR